MDSKIAKYRHNFKKANEKTSNMSDKARSEAKKKPSLRSFYFLKFYFGN
jgi:hypothetical protein